MQTSTLNALDHALEQLSAVGFKVGLAWEATHEICQAHEGESLFDAAHALCHRIEGDKGNAAYWYRRSGRPVAMGSLAEECAALRAEIAEA
ncbi:MAG: hypothetical protein CML23_12755 [Rhizobiaceae bacterium]|nr:hypothetical protein [Rhizobiaceae bacterium]|tara:strand:- start:316 stop:588 length:273 start_codon:yes stop_codon:yes gene_type:complete